MRQKVHLRAVAKIGVGNYDNSNVSIGRKSELTRLDRSNIGLLHDTLVSLISNYSICAAAFVENQRAELSCVP